MEILIFGEMGRASWSLLNLLLIIAGVAFAILAGARAKREMEKARYQGSETSSLRLGWMAVIGAAALVMLILFILTQDMRAPMVLIDLWTLIQVMAMALIIAATSLAFKRLANTFETNMDEQLFGYRERSNA